MGVPGATILRARDRGTMCSHARFSGRGDRCTVDTVLKGRREEETEDNLWEEVYGHQGLLHALTYGHTETCMYSRTNIHTHGRTHTNIHTHTGMHALRHIRKRAHRQTHSHRHVQTQTRA